MTERTRSRKINKIKFYSINRAIKEAVTSTKYSNGRIAQQHGVSVSTVQKIRRAKTWPNFLTAKQLTTTMVSRGKAAAFKKEQAAPTEKLARGLKKLENNPVEYMTTKQFTDAIDSLNGKIEHMRMNIKAIENNVTVHNKYVLIISRIINRIQQLKPRWFRES
jgi:hypothetical protein